MATVKVEFSNNDSVGEKFTLVFGDSYKTWKMQLQEYLWRRRNNSDVGVTIENIYLSHSRFTQDGLKWCTLEAYAKELKDLGRDINKFNWVKIDLPKSIEL